MAPANHAMRNKVGLSRRSTSMPEVALIALRTVSSALVLLAPQTLSAMILPCARFFRCGLSEAQCLVFGNVWKSMATGPSERTLWRLTFEVSGRRRQDAKPELAKMYRVPPAWAWWPAGGAPLDRGVRPHSAPRLRTHECAATQQRSSERPARQLLRCRSGPPNRGRHDATPHT